MMSSGRLRPTLERTDRTLGNCARVVRPTACWSITVIQHQTAAWCLLVPCVGEELRILVKRHAFASPCRCLSPTDQLGVASAKPLVPFDNALAPGQLPGPQFGDHVVIVLADHRLAVAHIFGQKGDRHAVHQALRGVEVPTSVQRTEHPRYRIAAQSEMIQHVGKYPRRILSAAVRPMAERTDSRVGCCADSPRSHWRRSRPAGCVYPATQARHRATAPRRHDRSFACPGHCGL